MADYRSVASVAAKVYRLMPAKHTVFCRLETKTRRFLLRAEKHSSLAGISAHELTAVIEAQNACIDALNARLHKLEDRVHEDDRLRLEASDESDDE